MAKGDPKIVTGSLPQQIQAFQVIAVGAADPRTQQRQLLLANNSNVILSAKQHNAFLPVIGDYYVVPSEGHPYCITKNQFAQSYTIGEN